MDDAETEKYNFESNEPLQEPYIIFCLTITCDMEIDIVKGNILSVFESIIKFRTHDWEDLSFWRNSLPLWFMSQFASDKSHNEGQQWVNEWNTKAYKDKLLSSRDNANWSLSNWLYWMDPEVRDWYWWKYLIHNDKEFTLCLGSDEFYCPLEAVKWALVQCGGKYLKEDILSFQDFNNREW